MSFTYPYELKSKSIADDIALNYVKENLSSLLTAGIRLSRDKYKNLADHIPISEFNRVTKALSYEKEQNETEVNDTATPAVSSENEQKNVQDKSINEQQSQNNQLLTESFTVSFSSVDYNLFNLLQCTYQSDETPTADSSITLQVDELLTKLILEDWLQTHVQDFLVHFFDKNLNESYDYSSRGLLMEKMFLNQLKLLGEDASLMVNQLPFFIGKKDVPLWLNDFNFKVTKFIKIIFL